jgi:hypothetical protein
MGQSELCLYGYNVSLAAIYMSPEELQRGVDIYIGSKRFVFTDIVNILERRRSQPFYRPPGNAIQSTTFLQGLGYSFPCGGL